MYESTMSVFFKRNWDRDLPIIPVLTNPEEKVKDLIIKYRMKSGDQDLTEKYIFNAKHLEETLTVAETGITNNAYIYVLQTNFNYSQQNPNLSNINNNNYYNQNSQLNNEILNLKKELIDKNQIIKTL